MRYDEEDRRKLNELLSMGSISSDGRLNGQYNLTLASLMNDNSEPGVTFAQPQFQQSEMDRNREQFAREDVRAMERGFNPEQFRSPQPAPQAPEPQNYFQRSGGPKISLDQFAGNRPHDVFRDGPLELGRQRTPDGGEMIIKRVPSMDSFGRQSAQVIREFVSPVNLDAMKKGLEIKKMQQELNQGPKAPAGYRFNGEALEAIPGGPADLKAEGRFNQDMAAMTSTEAAMNDLAAVANQLKGHSGLDAATGWQTMFPTVPGSQAANATALMDTLKAKTAFGTLQAMRDASKTGGALGAVSEKELKLLESALAPLSTAQSPDEYRNALDNLVKHTESAKSRLQGSFNMVHKNRTGMQGSPSQQAPQGNHAVVANDADYYALPKGAIYVTPDGQTRVKR